MRRAFRTAGLTLVEILLALAILALAVGMAYPIFFTGHGAYGRGEDQYTIHRDETRAAKEISDMARYATYIQILPAGSIPEDVGDDSYIFADRDPVSNTPRIILRDRHGDTVLAEEPAPTDELALFFASRRSGDMLYFQISGKSGTQPYSLETEVLLQNRQVALVDRTEGRGGPVLLLGDASFTRLKVAAVDKKVTMLAPANTTVDVNDCSWTIEALNGTLKPEFSMDDLILSGLPGGLTATASAQGNVITITVRGTASAPVTASTAVSVVVKGTAVSEARMLAANEVTVYLVPGSQPGGGLYVLCLGGTSPVAFGNTPHITGDILVRGDLISKGGADAWFHGNVYVGGSLDLENTTAFGTASSPVKVYVDGDITHVKGQPSTVYGDFYYEGSFNARDQQNLIVTGTRQQCPVTIPPETMPSLYPEQWYRDHGYTVINGQPAWNFRLQSGTKYYFTSTDLSLGKQSNISNVTVVSPGDITFSNGISSFNDLIVACGGDMTIKGSLETGSGVFAAPQGNIDFNYWNGTLSGMIIANSASFSGSAINLSIKSDYTDLPFHY